MCCSNYDIMPARVSELETQYVFIHEAWYNGVKYEYEAFYYSMQHVKYK